MSSEVQILSDLKNELVKFLDELIELFPSEPDFVIFRILVKDKIPTVSIMNYIVNKLCPLHYMIKNRNEKFFLDQNILFESFSDGEKERVNYFKNIWTSGLDEENKEIMWTWFASFVYMANKYRELKK